MESLEQKYQKLSQALMTLSEAVDKFSDFKEIHRKKYAPQEEAKIYRVFRDSLIQRFEYSTDLFWKYLKTYLETKSLLTNIISPAIAIQESCSYGLLSELEGHQLLTMVKGRNKTSHIYVEQVAEQLAAKIPFYYGIMHAMLKRLQP